MPGHPHEHLSRPTLPRPPHPVPTIVTMANALFSGQDGASLSDDLPDGLSEKYLRKGWTGIAVILPVGLTCNTQPEVRVSHRTHTDWPRAKDHL